MLAFAAVDSCGGLPFFSFRFPCRYLFSRYPPDVLVKLLQLSDREGICFAMPSLSSLQAVRSDSKGPFIKHWYVVFSRFRLILKSRRVASWRTVIAAVFSLVPAALYLNNICKTVCKISWVIRIDILAMHPGTILFPISAEGMAYSRGGCIPYLSASLLYDAFNPLLYPHPGPSERILNLTPVFSPSGTISGKAPTPSAGVHIYNFGVLPFS